MNLISRILHPITPKGMHAPGYKPMQYAFVNN